MPRKAKPKVEYFYWLRLPDGKAVSECGFRLIFPNRYSASLYQILHEGAKIVKEAYQ